MISLISLIIIVLGIGIILAGITAWLFKLPNINLATDAPIKAVVYGTCVIFFGVLIKLGTAMDSFKILFLIILLVLSAPVAIKTINGNNKE